MEIKIIKKYYDNGNLEFELGRMNGNPHGLQLYYHSNGEISNKFLCKNGMWNGLYQSWINDKRRIVICYFKNDLENGPNIIF